MEGIIKQRTMAKKKKTESMLKNDQEVNLTGGLDICIYSENSCKIMLKSLDCQGRELALHLLMGTP